MIVVSLLFLLSMELFDIVELAWPERAPIWLLWTLLQSEKRIKTR